MLETSVLGTLTNTVSNGEDSTNRRGSTASNVENRDEHEFEINNNPVMKRRQSLRPSDRNQDESIAPLLNQYNSIVQNIPESLPTTPGYEISHQMFENGLQQQQGIGLPVQRPNLYRKDTNLPTDISSWDNTNEIRDAISKIPTRRTSIIPEERINLTGEDDVSGGSTSHSGIMTFSNPPKNLWRAISCFGWSFTGGFSDGAPGALLPYIEEYYDISYSIVSLIWMSNAVGFILVALFSHKIQQWFSKRNSILLGCLSSCIMFALVLTGSKFPLIVTGFFFGGIGLAICLSQMNIFLSRLDKASTALGYYHGSYGLGASVSPLIATQFINRGIPWHYFYLILLGLMLFNAGNTYFAFAGSTTDLAPWEHVDEVANVKDDQEPINASGHEETDIGLQDLGRRASRISNSSERKQAREIVKDVKTPTEMHLALQNRLTWLMSFFVLFYQGAEVSMGGWIVTYLLDYRHGDAKTVGYVASGFWFGLTLGRLCLTRPFHKYVGARRGIIVMAVLSILAIILTWVIPNVIAAGIFVSIAGVFIGPTYPLMITLAARILPRKIQVVSLTIMTAFGSSGGAIFPFLVGLISQFSGPFVVLPIFIGLYTSMLILWIILPNVEGRERIGGKMSLWQRFW